MIEIYNPTEKTLKYQRTTDLQVVQSEPYNNKADIWSLGCILYQLCCLKPAFTGNNMLIVGREGGYPLLCDGVDGFGQIQPCYILRLLTLPIL